MTQILLQSQASLPASPLASQQTLNPGVTATTQWENGSGCDVADKHLVLQVNTAHWDPTHEVLHMLVVFLKCCAVVG